MLTIRSLQMDAIRDAVKSDYIPKLLTFLAEENSEVIALASMEECRKLIQACILSAANYGLHDFYEVKLFLQCALWLAPDFHTRLDWVQAILHDDHLPPEEKAKALESEAMDRLSGNN